MTAGFPLPDVDEDLLAPFWQAARVGQLVAQVCAACGHLQWPPRYRCTDCRGGRLAWRSVPAVGRLFSWVVSHRAFGDTAVEVPYTIGLVELEGARLRFLGGVVGTGEATLAAGDRMVAVFEHVSDDVTLVNWRREPSPE